MSHPALRSLEHLPTPAPARPWALTMRWEHLLFLHWPVPVAALRPHLPEGLEPDTFDGSAWLGVVPFEMAATRCRWLPPVPTAARFPECNLRTYVRHRGRAGVWFCSLDAASRLAVEGARLGFGLPYFRAAMRCRVVDGGIDYASERRDRRGPPATFAARWRAVGGHRASAAGSLQYFLTERYCLFAQRRRRLVRGDIVHAPWQLASVDCALERCDMTRLVGVDLAGPPVSALAALPVDVAAWSPVPADGG